MIIFINYFLYYAQLGTFFASNELEDQSKKTKRGRPPKQKTFKEAIDDAKQKVVVGAIPESFEDIEDGECEESKKQFLCATWFDGLPSVLKKYLDEGRTPLDDRGNQLYRKSKELDMIEFYIGFGDLKANSKLTKDIPIIYFITSFRVGAKYNAIKGLFSRNDKMNIISTKNKVLLDFLFDSEGEIGDRFKELLFRSSTGYFKSKPVSYYESHHRRFISIDHLYVPVFYMDENNKPTIDIEREYLKYRTRKKKKKP